MILGQVEIRVLVTPIHCVVSSEGGFDWDLRDGGENVSGDILGVKIEKGKPVNFTGEPFSAPGIMTVEWSVDGPFIVRIQDLGPVIV